MSSRRPAARAVQPQSRHVREDLYCPAEYDDDEILCEVDHDYANTPERKARYTQAAQRYLEGKDMMLLTTRLRGPFDEKDGWVNPWRTNGRRPARSKPRLIQSLSKSKSDVRSHKSPQPTRTVEEPDSLECHLPSPESLTQEPASQSLPFLETAKRDRVKEWRDKIEAEGPRKDKFWFTEGNVREKRKAQESSWLKSRATKKARLQEEESDSEASEVDELSMLAASSPVRRWPSQGGNVLIKRRPTSNQRPIASGFKSSPIASQSKRKAAKEQSPDELTHNATPAQTKRSVKHSSQTQNSSFPFTPSSSTKDPSVHGDHIQQTIVEEASTLR